MPAKFAQVPLSALSVGTILTTPIFDPNHAGTKLLGAKIEINAQFLKQLSQRGIDTVVVSQRDLAAIHSGTPQGNRTKVPDHKYHTSTLESDLSRELDASIDSIDLDPQDIARGETKLNAAPTDRYDREAMSEAVNRREQQIGYMDELFTDLVGGGGQASAGGLESICHDSIESVLSDKDLFLCLGLNPFHTDYPVRHSLHTCSIAISIGVVLGLNDQSLTDLGTGCLIHDVGMLKLGRQLYKSKRSLTESELTVLADHPVLTLEALQCPGARISPVSRIVAYQIHERCDGSGYPRGRKGDEIHVLSKIAAVADAYVALVSNREHRRGMLPYFAIEKLLQGVADGMFDSKAVRGLLQAVSLFPIGSFVQTSDGRTARVVRATGETYTQPMIEFWNDGHGVFEGDLINLVDEPEMAIVRATVAPKTE